MLNYHSTMLSLLLLLSVIKVDFNVAVEIYSHSRVSRNGNQIIFQSDMRNRTSDRLPTRATDIDSMLIDNNIKNRNEIIKNLTEEQEEKKIGDKTEKSIGRAIQSKFYFPLKNLLMYPLQNNRCNTTAQKPQQMQMSDQMSMTSVHMDQSLNYVMDGSDMMGPPTPKNMGSPYGDIIYDDPHYHHRHEQEKTTTTTDASEEPRLKKYSYFYLGRKLWYIPLFFTTIWILYVGALIIRSIFRHKIESPNHYQRSLNNLSPKETVDKINEMTAFTMKQIEEFKEKYL